MATPSNQPPRAELKPGTYLAGKTLTARNRDQQVHAFLGVPYAKPPLGNLRFRAPEPLQLWEGERQATKFGASCPQDSAFSTSMAVKMYPPKNQSEDCLYLNVWTPTMDPKAKKAVMVWVHGGSFMSGWSNMYQGTSLCAYEDVVFVSINYRVGFYGFMTTGDDVAPGNQGLLDQIEALRWVQKNIQAFGGDPGNVTLFGESAGGMSASILMLCEATRGLFHRAICQSGTTACPGFIWTREYAKKSLNRLLKRMGCSATSSEEILEFLQSQPQDIIGKTLSPLENFRPVIDDNLLKADHILSCKNPNLEPREVIFGCNDSEGAIFTYVFCGFQVPNKEFCSVAVQKSIEWAFNEDKADVDGFTEAVMQEYFGHLEHDDKENLLQGYVELMGDVVFAFPTCVAARAHCSAGGTAYMYYCKNRPSICPYDPEWVGSDHSDEIGLVLGWPFHDVTDQIDVKYDDSEAELSTKVMKYWANFAKTGNPNSEGLQEWPQYTTSDHSHLIIDKRLPTGEKVQILERSHRKI